MEPTTTTCDAQLLQDLAQVDFLAPSCCSLRKQSTSSCCGPPIVPTNTVLCQPDSCSSPKVSCCKAVTSPSTASLTTSCCSSSSCEDSPRPKSNCCSEQTNNCSSTLTKKQKRLADRAQRCKRDRAKLKLEMETLRHTVVDLNEKVSTLQLLQQIDHDFIMSDWEEQAKIQIGNHKRSVQENEKLRAALTDHLILADELQRKITKRPRLAELTAVNQNDWSLYRISTNEDNSTGFNSLIDDEYNRLEAVLVKNGLLETPDSNEATVRCCCDPISNSKAIEMVRSYPVELPWMALAQSVWSIWSQGFELEYAHKNAIYQCAELLNANSAYVTFSANLSTDVNIALPVQGNLVVKRYMETSRVVFVWRSVKKNGVDTETHIQDDECGWLIIEPLTNNTSYVKLVLTSMLSVSDEDIPDDINDNDDDVQELTQAMSIKCHLKSTSDREIKLMRLWAQYFERTWDAMVPPTAAQKPASGLRPLAVVTLLSTGAGFGYAMNKGQVYLPFVIIEQMSFHRFTMMKMFTAALGMSLISKATFRMLLPNEFDEMQSKRASSPSTASVLVIGGLILGAGMTISGSCPGSVYVQLGAQVPTALWCFLGTASGAYLTSLSRSFISACQEGKAKVATTVPLGWVGQGMIGVTLLAASAGLGKMLPEVVPSYAWNPSVAGAVVGALQMPMIFLLRKSLGASAGVKIALGEMAASARCVVGDAKCLQLPRFSDFSQAIFVIGIILGSFYAGNSSQAIANEVLPSTAESIIGGAMIAIGAGLAGGCTSGHGLSGVAMLMKSSWYVLPAIFIGGKKSGLGGLKKDGWNQLTLVFNSKAQTEYSKLQLQSRVNQLKRNYFIVKTLQLNSSFNWDEVNSLPTAPDNVWTDYIKEHPEAVPYRFKPFKFFQELDEIFSESFREIEQSTRTVEQLKGKHNYDNQLTEEDSSESEDSRPSKKQCCSYSTTSHGLATLDQIRQVLQQHQTTNTPSSNKTKEIALQTFRSIGHKLPVRIKLTFSKYLAMTDNAAMLFDNIDTETKIALIAEIESLC
ncbi:hypothetical protein THRCLA_08203 [Thraustotheca clavata]|uniref:Myb/SANT-like domain-containing protein n=1 Tax=Thraustotheca clavata TaxID=74557 RepID=A0A1V9Z8I4_9STRA|nr:hypothetical protein THRCLA_08203 [Thraustotheca clavata]